jgi:hypothetical protein
VHPDDANGDVFAEPTTVWIGAAGVVWALTELGADADVAALAERALARYLDQPDFGDHTAGISFGEGGIRSSPSGRPATGATPSGCSS